MPGAGFEPATARSVRSSPLQPGGEGNVSLSIALGGQAELPWHRLQNARRLRLKGFSVQGRRSRPSVNFGFGSHGRATSRQIFSVPSVRGSWVKVERDLQASTSVSCLARASHVRNTAAKTELVDSIVTKRTGVIGIRDFVGSLSEPFEMRIFFHRLRHGHRSQSKALRFNHSRAW